MRQAPMFPGIDRKQAAAESLRNYQESWVNPFIHTSIKDNPP
jgi:hypothetical protein